jgi:hypothetical protein
VYVDIQITSVYYLSHLDVMPYKKMKENREIDHVADIVTATFQTEEHVNGGMLSMNFAFYVDDTLLDFQLQRLDVNE